MRTSFTCGLLLASVACSGATSPGPAASASLQVRNLVPAAGSEATARTVISADVGYSITGFLASEEYFLILVFAQHGTKDSTFNALPHFSDATRLASAQGSVHLAYPIYDEWQSGKLAKPVRAWFYVLHKNAKHDGRIIGKEGPFEFSVP